MIPVNKLTDIDHIIDNSYLTLSQLKYAVDYAIQNAMRNNKNPEDVVVTIQNSSTYYKYIPTYTSFGFDGHGNVFFNIPYFESNQIDMSPPDERPEYGEYWTSRGPGGDTCSGFVKSKAAGERIMRYVKAILETDTPKTWLDYREREPNWIQLKFKEDEFDLELLDKLTTKNNHIITYEIMQQCKK